MKRLGTTPQGPTEGPGSPMDATDYQETVSQMDATNIPLVNQRGVVASVDEDIAKILEGSFFTVPELIYECAAWKEGLGVDGPTMCQSWSHRWGLCFAACFDLFLLIS